MLTPMGHIGTPTSFLKVPAHVVFCGRLTRKDHLKVRNFTDPDVYKEQYEVTLPEWDKGPKHQRPKRPHRDAHMIPAELIAKVLDDLPLPTEDNFRAAEGLAPTAAANNLDKHLHRRIEDSIDGSASAGPKKHPQTWWDAVARPLRAGAEVEPAPAWLTAAPTGKPPPPKKRRRNAGTVTRTRRIPVKVVEPAVEEQCRGWAGCVRVVHKKTVKLDWEQNYAPDEEDGVQRDLTTEEHLFEDERYLLQLPAYARQHTVQAVFSAKRGFETKLRRRQIRHYLMKPKSKKGKRQTVLVRSYRLDARTKTTKLGAGMAEDGTTRVTRPQIELRVVGRLPLELRERQDTKLKESEVKLVREPRGRWYVCIPLEFEQTRSGKTGVAALDPGIEPAFAVYGNTGLVARLGTSREHLQKHRARAGRRAARAKFKKLHACRVAEPAKHC